MHESMVPWFILLLSQSVQTQTTSWVLGFDRQLDLSDTVQSASICCRRGQ